MRISPIVLLAFAILGCGSGNEPTPMESGGDQARQDNVAIPANQVSTSASTIRGQSVNEQSADEQSVSVENPHVVANKNQVKPGQSPMGETIVNSIGMKLILITAGEFRMGSLDSDKLATGIEKPQHLVKITKPIYMGMYEVTQKQYEEVMASRPWQNDRRVPTGPDYPATYVSWADATVFCKFLSKKEGVEYRLPTEAEWEHACRAGTTTIYSFGNDAAQLGKYAWHEKTAKGIGEMYAHRVGQKMPNPWGLYDMHGNVNEWCNDRYAEYDKEATTVTDPQVGPEGKGHVLRGGTFLNRWSRLRSAYRSRFPVASARINDAGFRVVRIYKSSQ